jgi:antitoxin component YwqK of YwqJK toxin-antitoxin module
MEQKPQQDLSLLPGIYYHPKAELVESILDRGHLLKGSMHGIWEHYQEGFLRARSCYLEGIPHGISENYWWETKGIRERGHYFHGEKHRVWERYESDGTLESKKTYIHGNQYPIRFFIELLLDTQILDI